MYYEQVNMHKIIDKNDTKGGKIYFLPGDVISARYFCPYKFSPLFATESPSLLLSPLPVRLTMLMIFHKEFTVESISACKSMFMAPYGVKNSLC